MLKIRVLIVDDSVVARRVLSDIVAADPELEVAGTAANGSVGLQKIPQVNPDAIILDAEMPVLNGLETLMAIRKTYPAMPVIMFSTNSERGAAATIEALSMGASDFVTKPSNTGDARSLVSAIGEELIRKLKILTARAIKRSATPAAPVPMRNKLPVPAARRRIELLAIGSSTGGPAALGEVLPRLAPRPQVPVLIVQHMPPMFTRMLAERLTTLCGYPVHEAAHGMPVRSGHAYIAPGNFHMELKSINKELVLHTHQGPQENSCRPAVDVLFRSVAEIIGSATLAVVLTGMGQDGLRGIEVIHHAGGAVWAQDEASSVVWGMPGVVARSGLAERILPLGEVGPALSSRLQEFRLSAPASRPLHAVEAK